MSPPLLWMGLCIAILAVLGRRGRAWVEGVGVDLCTMTSSEALVRACECGAWGAVRRMLREPGVDVNARAGSWGITGLTQACAAGELEGVEVLLGVPGIEVNPVDSAVGRTPLHHASDRGHVRMVRALLRAHGIREGLADVWGDTPLHCASRRGHVEVVRALLRVPGIEVNCADNEGLTPLHWASHGGKLEVVQALLRVPGIEVNRRDRGGRSPLELLCGVDRGAQDFVRRTKATAAAVLKVLRLGGLPGCVAEDVAMACLDGRERVAAELLRAGATASRPSEQLRQARQF